jgi:NTP pyrophosphatase (non-canonical NTP hydrolase)
MIFSNGLTHDMSERLAILTEEIGEVLQVIGKIERHGYESSHPDRPENTNRDDLERELGHVQAAIDIMCGLFDGGLGDLEDGRIHASRVQKLDDIVPFLHHQQPPA